MSLHHATMRQLKVFDALAHHGSVARAAEALHLTPPAVSIQARQLAEAVGQPLTEQIGKQLYLTAAGKAVAAACRDLFGRIESLDQELAALLGVERGSLALSIISTASYVVPRLLGRFRETHPGIAVSMFVGNREAILDRLDHNEDDLYVLGQPPESARIAAVPFAANPLVAVAPAGHALADGRNIDPERLAAEPFIARERGSGTRIAAEAFFARNGLSPNIRLELGSNEAVKQSVLGRLGLSILSEATIRSELASGELVRLEVAGLPLVRQWFVAHPEGKLLSPAARAFREFLVQPG